MECVLKWYQQAWFITSLPFVFTGFGWMIKTCYVSLKNRNIPYKKDREVFESIQDRLSESIKDADDSEKYIEKFRKTSIMWFLKNYTNIYSKTFSFMFDEHTEDLRNIILFLKRPENCFKNHNLEKIKDKLIKRFNSMYFTFRFFLEHKPNNCNSLDFAERTTWIRKYYFHYNIYLTYSLYEKFIKLGNDELYKEKCF